MIQVSIIITNYNKGPYLLESIESAIHQDFQNFEVLIIDDGSTDNSRTIIERYRAQANVRIEYQENHGIIFTRNKAIELAKGEYILQLDGDDLIHKNYLKWAVPVLENDPKVGIAFCKTELFGGREGIWDRGAYSIESQLSANLIVITSLFRKADFEKTPRYRFLFKDGLEDWDVWLSILELGLEAKEINQVGFYYRFLSDGRNNQYSQQKEIELKTMIFKCHNDLYLKKNLDPVNLLWEIRKLEEQNKSLSLVQNSLEYKLGKFLLLGLRVIQKKIRR